jgi:hypothetical protein
MATTAGRSVSTPNSKTNEQTALALVGKITEAGIIIPQQARYNLQAAGFNEAQVNQILAMTLAVGMDPTALDEKENVAAAIKAYSLVAEYSYMPGTDFYAVNYGKSSNDEGGKKPSYAIVISKDRLQENVANFGRTTGVVYLLEKRMIVDPEEVSKLLAIYGPPTFIKDPGNRVCKARFVPVIQGQKMLDPDDGWEYGFALAKGYKAFRRDGGSYDAGIDGKGVQYNPNNLLSDIAMRRAIRKAAKAVAPGLIPADRSSVETRIERALGATRNLIEQKGVGPTRNTYNELDVDSDEGGVVEATVDAEEIDVVEALVVTADGEIVRDEPPSVPFTEQVWQSCAPETRAWTAAIAEKAEANTTVVDETVVNAMRTWIEQIGKWEKDRELADNITMADAAICIIFGTDPGAKPTVGAAQAFFSTTGKKNGKKWEIVDGSEGYKAVADIATTMTAGAEEF